ncbi:MAG: hypothetical protein HC937_01200, partial [Aquincola sp.]|nr:hypothetical protein [Aquincola sp.]
MFFTNAKTPDDVVYTINMAANPASKVATPSNYAWIEKAEKVDGKTVREYSTLDIAGKPDNVSSSVSHYTVIEEVLGFRWVRGNEYVFELRTTDGRTL